MFSAVILSYIGTYLDEEVVCELAGALDDLIAVLGDVDGGAGSLVPAVQDDGVDARELDRVLLVPAEHVVTRFVLAVVLRK